MRLCDEGGFVNVYVAKPARRARKGDGETTLHAALMSNVTIGTHFASRTAGGGGHSGIPASGTLAGGRGGAGSSDRLA